jgi:hypothetical protein
MTKVQAYQFAKQLKDKRDPRKQFELWRSS